MQRALLLLALPVHSCATGQNCAPPCSSAPDAPAASDASLGLSQRHTGTGTGSAALALASGRRRQHKLHPQASGTRTESTRSSADDESITNKPSFTTGVIAEATHTTQKHVSHTDSANPSCSSRREDGWVCTSVFSDQVRLTIPRPSVSTVLQARRLRQRALGECQPA